MTTSLELIIYLEPSAEFKQQVEHFLDTCREKHGPTTANKYGCHITMTGFFNVNNVQEQHQMKQLVEKLLQNMGKVSLPLVERKSLLVKDKFTLLPIHLLLPVSVPEQFSTFMMNLSRECETITTLRLKKINHISLAYWDEPEATQEQQERWHMATTEQDLFEKIQYDADVYFGNVNDPNYWDIVLYQRKQKGKLVGEPHIFQELGRWRV